MVGKISRKRISRYLPSPPPALLGLGATTDGASVGSRLVVIVANQSEPVAHEGRPAEPVAPVRWARKYPSPSFVLSLGQYLYLVRGA
ncbi:hypothetical protein GCM10017602_19530 [Herbiconiux flava]|nr:hypothetical protein GCM10017602_19530 [Herbiconiux flava]